MRKVTCRVTGETGYSNEFYKAPNGKYYKSKELYESTMAQREYKTKILYLINSDILNKNTSNCASLLSHPKQRNNICNRQPNHSKRSDDYGDKIYY